MTDKPKRPRPDIGRPKLAVFRDPMSIEYVKNNAFCTTKVDMAAYLGISVTSLNKHYEREMQMSKAIWVNKTLVATELALAEGTPAVINKLLGTICNLNETVKTELTGKDGGAIELVSKPPPITREEWLKQYQKRLVNPQPDVEELEPIAADDQFDD